MRTLSFLLSSVAVLTCAPPVANRPVDPKPKRQVGWQPPAPLCTVQDPRINESSGVGMGWHAANTYFTHNDSGDNARFFKFDSTGAVLGVFSLQGAGAIDWEDMASAKVNGTPYLYLGDIGDNAKVRSNIKIYRVEEPTSTGGTLSNFQTYTLTYPDGPHNAETLMVRPATGDIYVVTKTSGEDSQIFKLAAPASSGSYTMTEIGRIRLGSANPSTQLITGGDISPNGQHIALRTYQGGYEIQVPRAFDSWPRARALPIALASEAQGEAICYTWDSNALITTSEGSPMPASIVRRN